MTKVEFQKLKIGDFFKFGISYYMATPEMWVSNNWDSIIKVNSVSFYPNKTESCCRCRYFTANELVDKIELHELNTIIETEKESITFNDLYIGDKFVFKYFSTVYVKTDKYYAVKLDEGKIVKVNSCASVTKV